MRLKGQKTKSQISAQICGWVHYLPFRKKTLVPILMMQMGNLRPIFFSIVSNQSIQIP
jgi:hypothetical protein